MSKNTRHSPHKKSRGKNSLGVRQNIIVQKLMFYSLFIVLFCISKSILFFKYDHKKN